MKKLLKLFGLLLAMGTLFCLSSCDDLFNMDNNEDKPVEEKAKEYVKSTDAINHEFYLSDDKTQYIYYTSTTAFNYQDYENCIYQISFTPKNSAATKGTWIIYTRPINSYNTIERLYEGCSGTFEGVNNGSVRNGGTVKLLLDNQEISTVTIENKTLTNEKNKTVTAYAFTLNVVAAHKYIGAEDVK